VTRKITRGLCNIALGLEKCLYLGNLNALRDWGHAKDYVRTQWMMLQQKEPKDYVIATGSQLSVREFLKMSAKELGISLRFEGEGVNEIGIVSLVEGSSAPHIKKGDVIVKIDSRYFRPSEVETLLGDASKAGKELGWIPEISSDQLCKEMVLSDLNEAKQNALLKAHGYKVNASS